MPQRSLEQGVKTPRSKPAHSQEPTVPVIRVGLWTRIRTHKVVEWTLVYAAAAYTLLHGVEMVSAALEWPHVIARVVTLVLLLGLPIATTLAWFHGHRAQRRVTGTELTILVALLVLAGGVLWFLGRPDQGQASMTTAALAPVSRGSPLAAVERPPEKSVAVLPFVDMSEKKDQEYFSDGLSEELIDMLTKVQDLRVPARTSSFYFKGRQTKISDIGRELGVSHVLEGSVRKSGNRIRVTAQLNRVDSGYHLWSATYDRELDDIFKVQEEIAAAVVKALEVSLQEAPAPRAPSLSNGEAYALALQARFLFHQFGGLASLNRAADYYEQALRIEPTSAAAWAGLSRVLISLWTFDRTQQQYRERAVQAAQRALALDPRSADAHIALGKIRFWCDWDWAAAEGEFQEARALDPHDSYANFFSGELAYALGKAPEAIEFYTRAIDQDPMNFSAIGSKARIYAALGRHADALAAIRRIAELNPNLYGINATIGIFELNAGGDVSSALASIDREPDDESRLWGRAWAYATLGRVADAEIAIARYEQKYGPTHPVDIAKLYAIHGEAGPAFAWLERAFQQRDPALVDVKLTRALASIRSDPRYRAFLRKMGLPE